MSIPGNLLKKLHFILHRAFVEARQLAWRQACGQLQDLADTFEILPTFLDDWQDAYLERIQALLRQYQEKHPETAFDYLSILELSDPSFAEVFEAREPF